jgi:hypothetical protein
MRVIHYQSYFTEGWTAVLLTQGEEIQNQQKSRGDRGRTAGALRLMALQRI